MRRKQIKVYRSFTKYPISKKITFTENLNTSMKDKPIFQSIIPFVTELVAVADEIKVKQVAVYHGTKEAKAELNQLIDQWNYKANRVASLIVIMAEDNPSIAIEAGFSVIGERNKPNIPTFQAKPGLNSGSVMLRRKSDDNAKAYIWNMCKGQTLSPDSVWTQIEITTTASVKIQGLEPGSYYWFKVAMLTTEGVTGFCDPIKILVA